MVARVYSCGDVAPDPSTRTVHVPAAEGRKTINSVVCWSDSARIIPLLLPGHSTVKSRSGTTRLPPLYDTSQVRATLTGSAVRVTFNPYILGVSPGPVLFE